jgi:cyclopropane fatty-acyl-phospholipid synthase-like methyltransferase
MKVYDKIWAQENPSKRYKTGISANLLRLFDSIKTERILDIGTGDGTNIVYLAKRGYKAYGLDISKEGIKKANLLAKKEGCKINLVCADMFDPLPYKSEFFDAVYSFQTIGHGRFWQIKRLFKEISRILKTGGIFSIKTASMNAVESKKRAKNKFIAKQTFIPLAGEEKGLVHYLFYPEQLEKEICKDGFELITLKCTDTHITADFKKSAKPKVL